MVIGTQGGNWAVAEAMTLHNFARPSFNSCNCAGGGYRRGVGTAGIGSLRPEYVL